MRFLNRLRRNRIETSSQAMGLTAKAFHLVEEGQYDRAIHLLKQVIKANPECGDAYNELAFIHGKIMGELDVAEEYALCAVESDPDNPKFHNTVHGIELERAKHLTTRQEIREAMRRRLKHLEHTIDTHPEYPTLHLSKATALALNGEPRDVWELELIQAEKLYSARGRRVGSNEPITSDAINEIITRTELECIVMSRHWEDAPD